METKQVSQSNLYIDITQLEHQAKNFKVGAIRHHLQAWSTLTSDQEVLNTVSGLPIELIGDIPQSRSFQYPIGCCKYYCKIL